MCTFKNSGMEIETLIQYIEGAGPHPIGVAFMKKSDMLGGNNE